MKITQFAKFMILVFVMALLAACGKATTEVEETVASTEHVDIVSEITVTVTTEISQTLSDELKSAYSILLDGWADNQAEYYLYDLTGDAVPELIVGSEQLTVYSYNESDVLTIGTLTGSVLYMSDSHGLLSYCENDGTYELMQYQFDGEMISETILISVSSSDGFDSRSEAYLADANEMTGYSLSERTPFNS